MENERDKILKIVGNNIKNIRKSKGYTQESFAETLGKSINYISLVELGKSGMSIPALIEICNILQVDMNYIFKGLLSYKPERKEQHIIDCISSFNEKDKEIIFNLIKYIEESKEY